MTPWRALYWCVFVATGVVYGIMIFGTLPTISRGAAGLIPFDMRPTGYTAADARLFLASLTDEARALYLGVQGRLDSIFPALFGISLIGAYSALVPNRALFRTLALVAVFAVAADYVENARVLRMLLSDGQVSETMAASASRATVTKTALNTVAMLALFAAVGIALRSWWKSR